MSITASAPERVTFDELRLAEILAMPPHPLADHLPHHVTLLHKHVEEVLSVPVPKLMYAEGFVVPAHPTTTMLANLQGATEGRIDRTKKVQSFITGEFETGRINATYLLGTSYDELRNFVGMTGKVKRWRPERTQNAVVTMSAELLPHSVAGWSWWLGSLVKYEEQKIDYLQGIRGV